MRVLPNERNLRSSCQRSGWRRHYDENIQNGRPVVVALFVRRLDRALREAIAIVLEYNEVRTRSRSGQGGRAI